MIKRMCHVCHRMIDFVLTTLRGVCINCICKIMQAYIRFKMRKKTGLELAELFGELIRKSLEREVDNQLGTNFDFTSLRRVFEIGTSSDCGGSQEGV